MSVNNIVGLLLSHACSVSTTKRSQTAFVTVNEDLGYMSVGRHPSQDRTSS